MAGKETMLFSESAIARRVEQLADEIVSSPQRPEIAVPILTGAVSVAAAVAVAKKHPRRMIEADYVGFKAGPDFLYGYGMDRADFGRGLPEIRIAREEY